MFLHLFLGCEAEPAPGPCPPDPVFWAPQLERFDLPVSPSLFVPDEQTFPRDDGQFGFGGAGSMSAELVATRGVTYTGAFSGSTEGTGSLIVEWLSDSGSIDTLASYSLAQPVEISVSPHTPGRVLRFTVTADASLSLDAFSLGYDEYAEVEDTGSGTLSLGFLLHIEDHNAFVNDEAVWWRRARVAEAIVDALWAHGVKTTIQPDSTFVKGTAVWNPDWFDRMAAKGVGWAAHLHDESEGEDRLESAAREAKKAFANVGIDVFDINGGFQLAIWDRFQQAGFRTMSAFKDASTQTGPPLVSVLPWRPPNGSGTENVDEFLSPDVNGPLLYLGGGMDREAAHARISDVYPRRLSQMLANTVEGETNTAYFITHVDLFGPPAASDEAQDEYLDSEVFQTDLAYYAAWLEAEMDPLVASGRVKWQTTEELAAPWLKRETDCSP